MQDAHAEENVTPVLGALRREKLCEGFNLR